MNRTTWYIKHFSELTTKELYHIIQLREDVFVVEQNCPYLDADGKDLDAFHIWCEDESKNILCTSRILKPGVSYPEVAIGRVCTSSKARGLKLGKEMMERCIAFIKQDLNQQMIRISAQTYLLKFYSDLGFHSTGKEYLEDNIPHVEMLLGE
jgi:ElaA protein